MRSFCTLVNATQLIKEPTRVTHTSSTLIDIILVSNPSLVKTSGVLDVTISDHFLIFALLDLKMPKPPATTITTRSFKRYDVAKFAEEISYIPWDSVKLLNSIEENVDAFNDLFLACLDNHAPIKTVKIRKKPSPFVNDDIKKLISEKNKLHRKARMSKNTDDWKAFVRLRQELKHNLRLAEVKYFNDEIQSNSNNTGAIWKTIRRALPKDSSSIQCLQYTKDTSALAEEFNNFFVSVGERAAHASTQLAEVHGLASPTMSSCMEPQDDDLFVFKPVSSTDVQKVITQMPNNKSPGYDKVPVSVIKDCLPSILPTITSLINCSFEKSVFPCAWKKAEVVPHLKEGDHEEANNNRPISLLPVLSKVVERLALDQYFTFLNEKKRLTCHQSGNRKHHSTETLNLMVTDHILKAIDDKKVTAMVLLDLSKAFDSICHSRLLDKMRSVGTSGSALEWFKSYLTDRTQRTRIGSSVSLPLTISHGVPQGSILGPMLFTLYMNDLPNLVLHSKVESYVDDSKLFLSFSAFSADDGCQKLLEDLNQVAAWCCQNKLLINPEKSKLILFGVKSYLRDVSSFQLTFLGKQLKPVTSCRDLGIVFDSAMSFNNHTESLASSLLSTLCQINRVKHLFDKKTLLLILNSLVFSKLFYCSTVWSGTTKRNIHKLQLMQNFAARILSNTRKFDHISPVICKLGWLSVSNALAFRDLVMVFKCLNGLAPPYLSTRFVKRSSIHSRNTRHSDDINLVKCRTSLAQRSFFFHAAKRWNDLPTSIKSASSLQSFKKVLRDYLKSTT